MISRRRRLNRLQFSDFKKKENIRGNVGGFSFEISSNGLEYSRISVVVGARCSKKATERNSIKRKIYGLLSDLPIAGWDVVIYVKKMPEEWAVVAGLLKGKIIAECKK